ncbi:MAG: hypothetical protein QOD30_1065 [Actinomycetota bacterium]|nr:hypothetical protein [Actinomycetota bacterium]
MTEHDHLDDEAISAVLDGEATAHEVAHVDGCASCAARLGELRDAALVVRTPVEPPSDVEREAAIAAAMAPRTASVTPIRRRVAPRWLGAAAAVLAVLAGIGVFAGVQRDRDDPKQPSAADSGAGGATSRAAPAPEASTFVTAVYDGGDLGDIDVHSLRTTIESALSPSRSSAAQAAGSSAGAASGTADDSAATTVAPKTPACEDTVRSGNPDLGALLYRALGHLDGEPVEVFAFDAGGRRWVYVVASDDCAIRNQTTYSA